MLQVIVVDDDEIVLLVQKKILQRCSIASNPLSFKEGRLALDYLTQTEDKNILILLDINMPAMNGWEFLKNLESITLDKNIFVIMVTSSIDNYDKKLAKKYHKVIGFIEKPITNDNCQNIQNLKELSPFFNPG